jgi:hypothetical protein
MLGTDILEDFLKEDEIVPRRKYGRLRKTVEVPPKGNCSRCRSGKFCPIEGHFGQDVRANKDWTGPSKIQKRTKSSS